MSKKKITIKSIEAYQTTDGHVFTGKGAKKEAIGHQKYLLTTDQIKHIAVKALDFVGHGLVRLSIDSDGHEAINSASDLNTIFLGILSDPRDDNDALLTFQDFVSVLMETSERFPGLVEKIMQLIGESVSGKVVVVKS